MYVYICIYIPKKVVWGKPITLDSRICHEFDFYDRNLILSAKRCRSFYETFLFNKSCTTVYFIIIIEGTACL